MNNQEKPSLENRLRATANKARKSGSAVDPSLEKRRQERHLLDAIDAQNAEWETVITPFHKYQATKTLLSLTKALRSGSRPKTETVLVGQESWKTSTTVRIDALEYTFDVVIETRRTSPTGRIEIQPLCRVDRKVSTHSVGIWLDSLLDRGLKRLNIGSGYVGQQCSLTNAEFTNREYGEIMNSIEADIEFYCSRIAPCIGPSA